MRSYDYAALANEPIAQGERTAENRRVFDMNCLTLVNAVRKAATPHPHEDPRMLWHQRYEAYYGDPIGVAVWYAKNVVRQAKKLGLYREPVDVRVLIDLDVSAGEEVR